MNKASNQKVMSKQSHHEQDDEPLGNEVADESTRMRGTSVNGDDKKRTAATMGNNPSFASSPSLRELSLLDSTTATLSSGLDSSAAAEQDGCGGNKPATLFSSPPSLISVWVCLL
ncbi:uncharacterized protein DS421_9g286900 [Arachis hypogaea]|nr:uncharacterized protein DS421_9g286900 [Arachis hypogaea]